MQTEAGRLVIRLGRAAEKDEYWWLPVGARHRFVDAEQAARLSQSRPALVLLDADCIRVDRLTLPTGVRPDEVALLLEEQLCEPLEDVEVLLLERKRDVALVATINHLLAETLKMRLQQQGIRFERCLPMAVCLAEALPDAGIWQLDTGTEHWMMDRDSLSLVIWSDVATVPHNPLQAEHSIRQVHLPDEYRQAAIPWLAEHLPGRMALWPVRRMPLPKWNPAFLPWLLLLPAVLLLLVLHGSSQHSPSHPRQDQLAGQLHWQQQRMNAWQSLERLLQARSHLQVRLLQMDERGIRVELDAVRPDDQQVLQQLPGGWQFESSGAVWELDL